MTNHQLHPPSEEGATGELQSIVRFRFHEGKLEEFKRLSAVCMEIVRSQDPGTLQYDTFFNEDESECIVLERFNDVDALLQHGANIGDEVPAELRANLAGGPVQVFLPYQAL